MADETKGKLKEKTGELTGDGDMEREGKVEKAAGKVKDAADKATDKVADTVKRD